MAARIKTEHAHGVRTSRASGSPNASSFPLIVELEPLFQCNLACSGCGKIQHPEHVLRRRMPVEQAIAAIEEAAPRWSRSPAASR